MTGLIKLTVRDGRDIYVNPDYIASFSKEYSEALFTSLWIAHDTEPVYVKETPEDIISKITELFQ